MGLGLSGNGSPETMYDEGDQNLAVQKLTNEKNRTAVKVVRKSTFYKTSL